MSNESRRSTPAFAGRAGAADAHHFVGVNKMVDGGTAAPGKANALAVWREVAERSAVQVRGGAKFLLVHEADAVQVGAALEAARAARPIPAQEPAGVDEIQALNQACWAFAYAMPHQLPGPIFNDLKLALTRAIEVYLEASRAARAAQPATPAQDAAATVANVGLEMAARWIEKRAEAYDEEHGSTDPETGTREYPGNGDEYYGELLEIAEGIRGLAAQPATPVAPSDEAWLPVESAPKDGSLLRLLVEFTEHSLDDDNTEPQATIGMNNLGNTEVDEWQFAGWCWTHDRFTQGEGKVIGWLPLLAASPRAETAATVAPIDMVLHCPACGLQHIDAPDERTPGWTNEPHRSHLCHGCNHVWRPADVPTNGVAAVKTRGKADSPIASPRADALVGLTPDEVSRVYSDQRVTFTVPDDSDRYPSTWMNTDSLRRLLLAYARALASKNGKALFGGA